MKSSKIFLVIVFGITFLLFSCQKNTKPPKNLQPIDWGNYNEVKTVIDNYSWRSCDDIPSGHAGKTIKVCGLIYLFGRLQSQFGLTDPSSEDYYNSVGVTVSPEIMDDFKSKLKTCDVTKKCYITGEFAIEMIHTQHCSLSPVVFLNSVDDIYFK